MKVLLKMENIVYIINLSLDLEYLKYFSFFICLNLIIYNYYSLFLNYIVNF